MTTFKERLEKMTNVIYNSFSETDILRWKHFHWPLKTEWWSKYGLEISTLVASACILEDRVRTHCAVALYLDEHPEIAKKYSPDQKGKYKYFDVLKLAREEENKK